ncbi:MAG: acyltransferase family protein, partial [Acidimicrobiales bacterium]
MSGESETATQPDQGVTRATAPPVRDRWLDLLRAGSLGVVVIWHWVFTIIRWEADGPHATNPIGTTRGLWLATWFLQVMPVFFAVGGAVHARALQKEPTWASFVGR